jgi:Family of unknown function (DUF6502)
MAPETTTPPDDEKQALLDAVRAVLAPLARLAVARGLPYAALEEAMRRAVVKAAADVNPQIAPHRSVSRISTATGINRREVTRLTQPETASPRRGRSVAAEVFAHWLGSRTYRDRKGRPRVLPRLGPEPSFETLAHAVTRDVHPRSLLDELLRLKLAVLDEATDTVALLRDGFVPSGDRVRMLGFLSDNVGDHLAASVDNVLADGRRHFEQAVFADGLSAASMGAVRAIVGPQWKGLLEALVPPLEKMIEADAEIPTAERRRVRIGLYAYDDATPEARQAAPAPAATAPKRRPRKT